MYIKAKIEKCLRESVSEVWSVSSSVNIEVTHSDFKNVDYCTNFALGALKKLKSEENNNLSTNKSNYQFGHTSYKNPIELAKKIKASLDEKIKKGELKEIEKIEVAGSGFINFFLSKKFLLDSIRDINKEGEDFGKTGLLGGKKVVIEHTQPNPLKEFHIGHLMNNAIGESVARILAENGAKTEVCSYHGDVGLHVAKAVWALDKKLSKTKSYDELKSKVENGNEQVELMFFVDSYPYGNKMYEEDEVAKGEILKINKEIYEKSNRWIDYLYRSAKKHSLDNFGSIYELLDSHFNGGHFFESESGEVGKKVVAENVGKVFENSDGATVFRGENFEPKTHTRVFLNSEGLPTYEAKEVGLAKIKKEKFGNYDVSITVTANEQDSFFDVVEVAIGQVFPELKGKLHHLSHGILRLPTGKMSSRTGEVITALSLIEQAKAKVSEKIADRGYSDREKEEIAELVAIGAIKYSILRQAIGGDIIFDFDKSLSFEGDSGPYLQYTAVRARAVLTKATEVGLSQKKIPKKSLFRKVLGSLFASLKAQPDIFSKEFFGSSQNSILTPDEWFLLRTLYRYPEVVERAGQEYAPHHLITYLTELASGFNTFYGNNKIIDPDNVAISQYRLAVTEATFNVLRNGLKLLAIKLPTKM